MVWKHFETFVKLQFYGRLKMCLVGNLWSLIAMCRETKCLILEPACDRCLFSDRLWLLMTSVSSLSSSRVARDNELMQDASTAPDDLWPPSKLEMTFVLSWPLELYCPPSFIFFLFPVIFCRYASAVDFLDILKFVSSSFF